MRKPRLLYAAILTGVLIGVYLYVNYRHLFDPLAGPNRPVSGTHIGQKKDEFVSQYGRPTKQWPGIYGGPPDDYSQSHPTAITLVYERASGTLYLAFEIINSEWVCFSSDWMPTGCVF
jgi:hypothetical protein